MKVLTQLACRKRQIGPVKVADESKHEEKRYEMSADFPHNSLRVDLFRSNSKQTKRFAIRYLRAEDASLIVTCSTSRALYSFGPCGANPVCRGVSAGTMRSPTWRRQQVITRVQCTT